MTKLDKLIQELCPDGVQFLRIPELFTTRNGYTPSKANSEFWENGTIPWFRMEDIRENGRILTTATQYVSEKAVKGKLFPADSIIIATSATIGEHALIKVPSLANQRFTYLTLKDEFKDCVDMMFVFYYCFRLDEYCKSHLNQGNFSSVDMKQFAAFKFPVPPLPVQREIVRILDNFTELTEGLNRELAAELTARKKQYAYYRDKLLTHSSDTKIYKLADVCESIADGDHMPPPKADDGIPFITISNITEQNKIDFSNTMFVPSSYYDALADKRKPHSGDILYTVVGSYGIPVCIEQDTKFVFQRHIAILRPRSEVIKARYMFHAMQSGAFKAQADKAAKGAAQKTIGLSSLVEMTLPVPNMCIQERLIRVLDNFDAICTDLNIGLPAEIEARQKQYEFYRDQLLTFAAQGETILTDRQTDRQTDEYSALIRLCQYVFGYVSIELGSIATVTKLAGYEFTKYVTYSDQGEIIALRGLNVKNGRLDLSDVKYIDESNLSKLTRSKLCIGDMLFTYVGTVGQVAVIHENDRYYLAPNVALIRVNKTLVDPEYMRYFFQTSAFWETQINRLLQSSSMQNIPMEKIRKFILQIPSLDEQRSIVSTLDRFDTLCTDLSSGLPAEIEARQKQYEYYRDKLLEFEK